MTKRGEPTAPGVPRPKPSDADPIVEHDPQQEPPLPTEVYAAIHEADFCINNVLVDWQSFVDALDRGEETSFSGNGVEQYKAFLLDRIRASGRAIEVMRNHSDEMVRDFGEVVARSRATVLTGMLGFLSLTRIGGAGERWAAQYSTYKPLIDDVGAHPLYQRYKRQVAATDAEATRNTLPVPSSEEPVLDEELP